MKISPKDVNIQRKTILNTAQWKIDDICFISVYNSPNSSFDCFEKTSLSSHIYFKKILRQDIVVVGDFNINLKIKANHKFIEYMESFGLTSDQQIE